MQISEEDRQAFHSQADRVSKAVEAQELRRLDKEGSVKVAYSNGSIDSLAVLTVAPRHRFIVEGVDGERFSTTRRDEAIDKIKDLT